MHEGPVDEAHVIGRDHHARAGGRHIVEAAQLDAKQGAEHEAAEVAQAVLTPGPQDEHHRGEIADGEDEEQRGERDAGFLGKGEDEAGACHESRRDHVHRGDDAGAHLRGRPGLDLREGGDDVEAAREGKAEKTGKKMPSASREQEGDR